MVSVMDELIALMGCLGFWLFLQNLICPKCRRTWVFRKINETGKSAEICYQLSQNTVLAISQKNLLKATIALEKSFNFSKLIRKIQERHHFTLNFVCKLDKVSVQNFFFIFCYNPELSKRNELKNLTRCQ